MDRYIWRILLIDDDEKDYLITRQMLSEAREGKFILEWACSYQTGQVALKAPSFDAVLVDYDLGVRSGIELIREAVSGGYPAPILLLTGRGTYEVDVQAMEAGAADYLCKGEMNAAFLERAIRYAIERKKGEQALRESQIDLAHAQAVSHTGSWRLDVRRDALLWSNETYRLFGLTPGTPLTYDAFLAKVHPDDREYVDRSWAAALGGEPYEIEHRIVVDDQIKWVRERAELEFDPQGVICSGFGTVQDITERKQAEQALRETLERAVWLAGFPDENPNPVARVSDSGIVLYRNPAAAKASGWALEIGKPLPEVLLPLVEQAIAQRQGVDQDVFLSDRFYSISVMPFAEERYVNFYGRDITKRKQVEAALCESEGRFRIALANPALAVFSTDTALRYTWFYSTAMGSLTDEFIGKRDDEILSSDDAVALMKLKQQALETRAAVQGELLLNYANQSRQFIISIEPYIDQTGCLDGVIGALFDVSEQRRLEAESFDYLTQMEIHHRLMEYREKERQRIAHDLHDGPVQDLSGLIFNIQVLKESLQDPVLRLEYEKIGATLKQTVQDLRGMMNELRPPSLIRFGITKAIHHYMEDFQDKHPELEIQLDLQPFDNQTRLSEQVNLTLFRIYQEALNNILSHAQATQIWVQLKHLPDYVILEVRDNGLGFPVSVALNKHTQNNHFGLAGMKERADAIGGEFNISSGPGKGTTIHVTVPLDGNI